MQYLYENVLVDKTIYSEDHWFSILVRIIGSDMHILRTIRLCIYLFVRTICSEIMAVAYSEDHWFSIFLRIMGHKIRNICCDKIEKR